MQGSTFSHRCPLENALFIQVFWHPNTLKFVNYVYIWVTHIQKQGPIVERFQQALSCKLTDAIALAYLPNPQLNAHYMSIVTSQLKANQVVALDSI